MEISIFTRKKALHHLLMIILGMVLTTMLSSYSYDDYSGHGYDYYQDDEEKVEKSNGEILSGLAWAVPFAIAGGLFLYKGWWYFKKKSLLAPYTDEWYLDGKKVKYSKKEYFLIALMVAVGAVGIFAIRNIWAGLSRFFLEPVIDGISLLWSIGLLGFIAIVLMISIPMVVVISVYGFFEEHIKESNSSKSNILRSIAMATYFCLLILEVFLVYHFLGSWIAGVFGRIADADFSNVIYLGVVIVIGVLAYFILPPFYSELQKKRESYKYEFKVNLKGSGNLGKEIPKEKKMLISHLVISGPVNDSDLEFIKDMAGYLANNDEKSKVGYLDGKLVVRKDLENTKLRYIDMSGATYEGNNQWDFRGTLRIKELYLPQGMTVVPRGAFEKSHLEYMHFPKSIRKVEDSCFGIYTKNLIFPEGVESIGSLNQKFLTYPILIVLPSTLKTINLWNIEYFGSAVIYCFSDEPPRLPEGASCSHGSMAANKNVKLYVPAGSVESYKNSSLWYLIDDIEIIDREKFINDVKETAR